MKYKPGSPNYSIYYTLVERLSRLVVVHNDGEIDPNADVRNPNADVWAWIRCTEWHNHRVSGEQEIAEAMWFIVNSDFDVHYLSNEHLLTGETYVGPKANERAKADVLKHTEKFISELMAND